MSHEITPFERIRRTNPAGHEYWSSRDFARVLGYTDYRNFEAVIEKARTACFNSGQRVEDHFVGITEMIAIGKGGQRPVQTVMMSRYACYLVIQNADPAKEIVAIGQTYFAVQTRRQERETVKDRGPGRTRPPCLQGNRRFRSNPATRHGNPHRSLPEIGNSQNPPRRRVVVRHSRCGRRPHRLLQSLRLSQGHAQARFGLG
jgi:DNA-damage-inducible protein D